MTIDLGDKDFNTMAGREKYFDTTLKISIPRAILLSNLLVLGQSN